jgi:GDP/UDP-N,N'-diacetylbacillosamine 2-epimerase (hydrolysing)
VRSAPRLTVHRNIVARDFWGLMARAAVLVGNSSAGLIETPYFTIPAINLGQRQKGRLHAENVIHAEFGEENVLAGLATTLDDQAFKAAVAKCSRPFGDGQAYRRIVNRLKYVQLDERLLSKRMTY